MRATVSILIEELTTPHSPESVTGQLGSQRGVVLLRNALFDSGRSRYSFITAEPFLTFVSRGSRCEVRQSGSTHVHFGNPWEVLNFLLARYELMDQVDFPFPLGGCFGFWGYDLRRFVEPTLSISAVNDLDLPDCVVGFYDSLVVFDHALDKTWIVSTGLAADGSRDRERARHRARFWKERLESELRVAPERERGSADSSAVKRPEKAKEEAAGRAPVVSNMSPEAYLSKVRRALQYIGTGDIYQVNLAHRLEAPLFLEPWPLYERLTGISPAPYAAFMDFDEFQLISSSPELFMRLSGAHIQTRPIKGTRPRSLDATRDAQLSYELQTSSKEMAELVMITDLLRNDLGKICEYGSVRVPELVRLERYPQVQHLVSTIEGELRSNLTHLQALAACFPGGSVTGAPKIRAMDIIDELEPVTRGPYTGCHGYLGFNRESQLSISIRTIIVTRTRQYFYTGAGIVADSNPEGEYRETIAKAGGFLAALGVKEECEHSLLSKF